VCLQCNIYTVIQVVIFITKGTETFTVFYVYPQQYCNLLYDLCGLLLSVYRERESTQFTAIYWLETFKPLCEFGYVLEEWHPT